MAIYKSIADDWKNGIVKNKDLITPVATAQCMFNSKAKSKDVVAIWESLYQLFTAWKEEKGEIPEAPANILGMDEEISDEERFKKAEPWDCAGYGIDNPLDLYVLLEEQGYPHLLTISKAIPKHIALAAITLRESVLADNLWPADQYNIHLVTAIRAERELNDYMLIHYYDISTHFIDKQHEKEAKQLQKLAENREKGSQKNKAKAEIRHEAIREAAIYKFRERPDFSYQQCITSLKQRDSVRQYLIPASGSMYSDETIKKIIKGTKQIALTPKD